MSEFLLQAIEQWDRGVMRPMPRVAPWPPRTIGAEERRGIEGRPAASTGNRGRRRRVTDAPEGAAAMPEEAAQAVLDKLNRGVLLIDAAGRVRFMNRAAHAMLARRSGFVLQGGRFGFRGGDSNAEFVRFLAIGSDSGGSSSLVLRIDGPRQQGSYRVLVSPLARNEPDAPEAGYCVFVYEPNGGQRPLPLQVLKHLYGLTAAEARLTNQLFVGKSLVDSAGALRVSRNTAKSSLKRVFAKCAVGSQAELLQLLSLGPRTL
jgi:DNA-binding CsgD family transcriptional regulator/PAS domain-containing protein